MPNEPTEVEDLVVIAKRITDRGGSLAPSYPLPEGGLETFDAALDGDAPEMPDPCSVPQAKTEKQADAKANSAATTIKGQNWQTQEYGAFIYRDAAGVIRVGVITGGTSGQWTPSAENMTGITSYTQILGFIHNHPANTEQGGDGTQPSAITDSSGQLIGGDWFTFQFIAQQISAAGGDATQLRQYVIGPDGKLRYFDASHLSNGGPGVEIDPAEQGCP